MPTPQGFACDDDTGGFVKNFYAFERRVGINNIVIGQGLTLKLLIVRNGTSQPRPSVTIKSQLVRVFAVSHLFHLVIRQGQESGSFSSRQDNRQR